MSEPVYDEDLVNLGYLKQAITQTEESIGKGISKHYATKPNPPYYKGDTWIDGRIVYTCVNDRLIGVYTDSDWVTESGAKEEAESKSRTFLVQPSKYNVGDMWILQSDEDHRAGRKGEVLISTAGRVEYDADDWVNMLGYGTIRSINEVANNINDAIERLELQKESGILTIWYSEPQNPTLNDLWYSNDKLYVFNENWTEIENMKVVSAFSEANQSRLVEDGKIQAFYSENEPEDANVGDIWTKTTTKELFRHNGTKWVAVYDTSLYEIRRNVNEVTEATTSLTTDLGKIQGEVATIKTTTEEIIDNKVDATEYNTTVETLRTMITQGNDQVEFKFQDIRETTHELANNITANKELIEEYIRFKGALIELGRVGNDFTAELSNTELAFLQNGNKIAYISNNKMYITDAEVQRQLTIGHFAFIPRSNGNLSFNWIG